MSEYYDLRSSPNQSLADFFHQSGYTASLLHSCNVSVDGRLQAGQVKITDELRKYCNSYQCFIKPADVFIRMLMLSCGRTRGRCTEVYRLTKMFSFESPICHYYHTDVKATELCMNHLGNNIIKELSDVAKADADSGADEAGPSRKVAEV